MSLTPEQQEAFDLLCQRKSVFVTGPAGSGKSHILRCYYDYAVNRYGPRKVYKTSSTGVSAILIGGKTIHSWAGIYLGEKSAEELVARMKFQNQQKWKRTKVLFIDEISMINPDLFDKLEKIARILRKTSLPFGGIQVVIIGDFFQLPVVKCDRFCFEAKTWEKVITRTIKLKTIVRQTDKKFQKMLNEIRLGKISQEHSDILHSRVDAELENELGIEPTILYPKNRDVNKLNNKKLGELLTLENKFTYTASYEIAYNNTNINKNMMIKNFQRIEQTVSDQIILAKGAQVVFKMNIDTEKGIANGSRGVVVNFMTEEEYGVIASLRLPGNKRYPLVRLLNGNVHLAIPVDFEYEITEEYKIIKKQVPLKLAWASTIHSCQGATLDYVKADIGEDIFEYGQAYVVLSRVRNLEGLTLIGYDPDSIRAHPKVLERFGKKGNSDNKNITVLKMFQTAKMKTD